MTFEELLEASYKKNYKKWIKQLSGGNITNEMAEDIIQTACVNALVGQDSYDKSRDFDKWFEWVISNARATIVSQEKRGGMSGRSV